MAQLEFTLRVVSPMFLNGADTRQPEIRAASVRGQLRYWLRTYLGAQENTLSKIWEGESAVFGSTGRGSAVSVRLFGSLDPEKHIASYPMLPHREGTQENVSKAKAIVPDKSFALELVTRPGVVLPQDALIALKLWSLLGGMGKRSRRMMGSIQILPRNDTPVDWYPALNSPNDLKTALDSVLPPRTIAMANVPNFPVLHPDHSWIIVGQKANDDPKEGNQEFFRQLLRNTKFRRNGDAFGYAKRDGRRASPIVAQIRKIGDSYYPVITAFRSNPAATPNYSDILRDFMNDATKHYNAIHVWGGW